MTFRKFADALSKPGSRGAALLLPLALAAVTGCGSNYRPVVTSINPVGPAGQPTRYAIAIATNGANSAGIVNFIDFSGDTIVNTTAIGINPQYLILGSGGTEAYVINGDGTLTTLAITTSLLSSQLQATTLPPGANPSSLFPQGSYEYVTEAGLNEIGILTGAGDPSFYENLPTGSAGGANSATTTSVFTVGLASAPRLYGIQASTLPNTNGFVAAIETSTNTISATIPVGVNPVYGVMEADSRRAYILNKGSNSVTVINSQANTLDSFQTVANGPASNTIQVGTAPVWADFIPTLNEMVVLNQGNGTTPGTLSIISIPLCTTTAVANPNCDTSNPIDAVGFGSVVATIPVGINPTQVTVLADGSQAFVANQGMLGNPSVPGSISVINLTSNTVTATIPAGASANETDAIVHGHPTYISSVAGLPTGKVYVTAPDSTDVTIIRTDTDAVLTHLTLQGNGSWVRVTQNQ
jgi:DNA-binding beta-propeller fold protein YncE